MPFLFGYIFVLIAGIGFGFLGIFGKLAFQSGLAVGELLTLRFFLASLLLVIFRPQLLRLEKKKSLISLSLGFFGYAVFSTLYFESLKGLSVSLAALLLFTFPLFVNLGSFFIFQHAISGRQWFSLFLAFVGLLVLLWTPDFQARWISVGSALAAAITYAGYVLLSGHYQKNSPALASSLFVMIGASLGLFLFHQPSFGAVLKLSALQWSYILGLAVICTILPLTLFLRGLQYIPSSKASIIVMVEPVVATLAAYFILGETLTSQQFIGTSLVLIALVL